MKVKKLSSWIVLLTGCSALLLAVTADLHLARLRADSPQSTVTNDQEQAGISRSAVWHQRLKAVQDKGSGGSGNYEMTMSGSNPTGTNQ